MDRIEGVSAIGAAQSDARPAGAMKPWALARRPVADLPTAPERPEAAGAGEGQVRAGPIGSGGRFEKLILAVQALHFGFAEDAPPAQVEKMRAAAEELFQIDGVPAPVEPPAGAAADNDPPPAEPAPEAPPPGTPPATGALPTERAEAMRWPAPTETAEPAAALPQASTATTAPRDSAS